MKNAADILGVVLTGGRSTRMGRDKGLLPLSALRDGEAETGISVGETWSERAGALFEELGLSFVLSVNAEQHEEYAHRFDADVLIEDDDQFASAHGPLRGILSVADRFPERDLFVLACDLPCMTIDVMRRVVDAYHAPGEYEYFAYNNPVGERGGIEPLCAVYTARALQRLRERYAGGANDEHDHFIHCPRKLLSTGLTMLLHAEEDARRALRNFNNQADLQAAAEQSS